MQQKIINAQDLAFQLFELHEVEKVLGHERYADHNRETLQAALDLSLKVAAEEFAPHARLVDEEEPRFENGQVVMRPEVKKALEALRDTGLMAGRSFVTMCLTEPQAGSSPGDLRTRAESQADGSYRLFGNKIYISARDHELSDNIIHMMNEARIGVGLGSVMLGYTGYLHALDYAREYFASYELPKVDSLARLLSALDTTPLSMQDSEF